MSGKATPRTITSRPNMKPVPGSQPEHDVFYSCDTAGELHIEGHDIHLSEIIDEKSLNLKKFDDLCKATKPFHKISMFGQNSVVIDRKIHLTSLTNGELQVAIAAPTWRTEGPQIINLNGARAESHKIKKASNGNLPTLHGKHGAPGLSGAPGGSFLGIAGKIDGDLTIYANGGEASAGQDGGDGVDAVTQTYPVPSNDKNKPPCQPDLCVDKRMQSLTNKNTVETFDCEQFDDGGGTLYKMVPKIGNYAGNGGNGGRAGIGGPAGEIKLYQLKGKKLSVPSSNKIGTHGAPGKGGRGGEGKKGYVKGKTAQIEVYSKRCRVYPDSDDEFEEVYPKDENILPGKKGQDDHNAEGQKPIDKTLTLEPAKIMNQYKGFLRGNLERNREDSTVQVIRDFIQSIDNNEETRNSYGTLDLVEEFEDLEKQMFSLGDKVDFIPFYESLLERLIAHAKKFESDPAHKKVVSFMFTAVYSRLFNMKENPDSLLILDMGAHLSKFENKLQQTELKSKDLTALKRTAEIIRELDEEKKKYKDDLDQKINETMNFRKDILTDIDDIERDIDTHIHTLIGEVMALLKNSKKVTAELEEKSRLLRRQMIWKGFFATLRFVGQGAQLLGPTGIAVNTFIQGTSSVVEPLFLGEKGSASAPTKVPDVVINIQGLVKSIKESRIKPLNEELGKLSTELGKHSSDSELKKAGEETSKIQEDLKKATNIEEVEKVEDRVKKQKEELEKKIDRNEQKFEKLVQVLDNFEKLSKLGSGLYNICNTIATSQEEIEAVETAIKLEKKAFEKLKLYEKNVHEVFTPILHMVAEDMENAAGNLAGKSHAALDMAKWNIRKHLSQVEGFVDEFTKEKDVKPAFLRTIKELNEAMNVLIDLYHLVQTYEEQKSFGDHLGNLISTAASKIDIKDGSLMIAKNELEIMLSSNLILQEYQKTIIAFKQFVFPYADEYFKDLRFLPNQLAGEASIGAPNSNDDTALSVASNSRHFDEHYFDEVITKVSTLVTVLNSKLQDHKNIVTGMNGCLLRGPFYNSDTTYPFHEWKNVNHNSMISKLLNGTEATLLADIRISPTEYDAVKFTNAKLKFVAKDEALQEKLNNELRLMKITMTHLGDSHYRYNDKYYKMTTNSVNMTYHLKDGGHIGDIYEILSNGTYVISPYASWKFQLFPTKTNGAINFDKLKGFSNDVDLVLEGEGRYVEADQAHCLTRNVGDYYKPIELPKLAQAERVRRSLRSIRHKRSAGATNDQNDSANDTSTYTWLKERVAGLFSKASKNIRETISNNSDSQNSSHVPLKINQTLVYAETDNANTIHSNNQPLLSPPTQKEDASIIQTPGRFDGNGLLLLTNLLVRKLTGEKYQPTALPAQEREEKLNDLKQQVFTALRDFDIEQEKYTANEINDSFQ